MRRQPITGPRASRPLSAIRREFVQLCREERRRALIERIIYLSVKCGAMQRRLKLATVLLFISAFSLQLSSLFAATVVVSSRDLVGNVRPNIRAVLTPTGALRTSTTNLIGRESVTNTLDSSGLCQFTNVLAGNYQLDLAGFPATVWKLVVPDTNLTFAASALVTNATASAAAGLPWDTRYVLSNLFAAYVSASAGSVAVTNPPWIFLGTSTGWTIKKTNGVTYFAVNDSGAGGIGIATTTGLANVANTADANLVAASNVLVAAQAQASNALALAMDLGARAIATDASTNPTTTVLVLTTNQNAVRVWTGERLAQETWLDIWYRTNAANTTKVRLYRWQGRILQVPPGSSIQIGATNSTTLWLAPMCVATNLATPAGVTNFAFSDRAGPPFWSPAAPHVWLPSNGCAFTVVSNRQEGAFFVSEFDGQAWTPLRWYIQPTNENMVILATYRQVAIANYEGRPLQIVAPIGSRIGGESRLMSIIPSGPGRFLCTSAAEFQQAISNAVAGDTISLADGTYALTVNVTNACFGSNQAAGFVGMEGITIRSLSGNPSAVVLTGSATNLGRWDFVNTRDTLPACIKGVTFNFSNQQSGFVWDGARLAMENVRIRGPVQNNGALIQFLMNQARMNADLLRVTACLDTNQSDVFSQSGTAGFIGTQSRLRLVDCVGYGSGTNSNNQVITTHFCQPVEVYGGSFWDAPGCTIAPGAWETTYCFFTRFPQFVVRTNFCKQVAFFGCDFATKYNGCITPAFGVAETNAYILFSRLAAVGSESTVVMVNVTAQPQDTNDIAVAHNRLLVTGGRGFFMRAGGRALVGNVFNGCAEGVRIQNYAMGQGIPCQILGNTFIGCTEAVNIAFTNFNICITNSAFITNATSFSPTANYKTNILSGYNVMLQGQYQPLYTTSDTTNAIAAVNSYNLRPVAAGNCDDTGIGYGWCGDSDPYGRVWLYHPSRAPIGAVAVPRWWGDGVMFPDVW